MNIIHAKALGIGAAVMLALATAGASSAQAQGVLSRGGLFRGGAYSNAGAAYPGYATPPGTYYTRGYSGYAVQPQAYNGYAPAYPGTVAQPMYNGYAQPGTTYYPTQYQYAQPTASRNPVVNAVRSVVQPQYSYGVAPGYAPQAAPMYVMPR
ncbi:hypothetical protein [Paludisphaera mucosa]|uniref:Uncharacterized protein n=1 Tax=Paludisphaera mucosa TaxID=3030827 RepID=A0ABT6FJP1_9BACT|nr:hypothetical protein [Paludisphaera mucosa]MDG3007800.1 hypothetical protein [Paludisphaera mucosa]